MEIREKLFALADEKYKAFQSKLLPTVAPECVIGVRTPALRALAKEIAGTKEAEAFLGQLPHTYFEENNLHAFLLCRIRDFDSCIAAVDAFLPYVDNWATCDQMSPKALQKDLPALRAQAEKWMRSAHPYTVRFGIGMLMQYFLDAEFSDAYPRAVAAVRSEEYYVQMMQAWYFATALAKQYEAVLPYFTEGRMDAWVQNKAIQKAIESYRVPDAHKAHLRTLKRK
ncbi:MAG: DNA alkylation repair protein [Clostridia bacterium]|nr:DNA alkylation repair protein [Clostridia bacterium]